MADQEAQVFSLPPGSTSDDLQAAINSAASGDIIEICDDMLFTNTVTLLKVLTIQSDQGNCWSLYPSSTLNMALFTVGNHSAVESSLTLNNIILDGRNITSGINSIYARVIMNAGSVIHNGYTSNNGGGISAYYGTIILNEGAIIENCYSENSGGGINASNIEFFLNEGAIIDSCSCKHAGGGLCLYYSRLTIKEGSAIRNCQADSSGGGLYIDGEMEIFGGVISGNTASFGGGISSSANSVVMYGGTISNNHALAGVGGGVQASNFTMKGGLITGNDAIYGGGGINTAYNFTLQDGIISNNKSLNGLGGGIYLSIGTGNIEGGVISGNQAKNGGAIYSDSTLTISNCKISDNIAENGGGIMLLLYLCSISDSEIVDNIASENGGGLHCGTIPEAMVATVLLSGVTISGNRADGDGGGIYSPEKRNLTLNNACMIVKNISGQRGGGLYCSNSFYDTLHIADDTVFSCNRALTAYAPPSDAKILYPEIEFAHTSITGHPLNNYDISYEGDEILDIVFHLSYNANGGVGSYTGPGILPGWADTVLSSAETGISRPDYSFVVWNTEPNGSGDYYNPGKEIILDCETELYAQWLSDPGFITITYNSNGGAGSHVDTPVHFDDYTVLTASQAEISRGGYVFSFWNSRPDGSGETFLPGDKIAPANDLSLFAQWRKLPASNRQCRHQESKSRISIEGQKIWADNENALGSRPPTVEILLLRDGEIYQRKELSSTGDGYFGFCCLPKRKNSGKAYDYRVDEVTPAGYTKTVEGYTITNTLIP